MKSQRETKIRQWMLSTVSNGGIERLDDLHVDDIDESWEPRSNWVDAGLTAYGLAVSIRREIGIDVTVALGFSLVDGEDGSKEIKKAFETKAEFEKQLDWSPPSLYLFRSGDQHHLSDAVAVDPLAKAIIVPLPEGTKSFLLQWTAEDGSKRRSVFVESEQPGYQ